LPIILAVSGSGSYYLSMRPASLKPYRSTSSPNRPWCVDIPEALSELAPPRRQRKFFETKKLADGECERLKALKDNQQRAPAALTPAQMLEAHEAFQLLIPLRIPLPEAVRAFLAAHEQRMASISFLELFNQFLEAKSDRNPEYLRELRITRDRFPALHQRKVSEITPLELETILSPLTPGARNPVMRYLRAVFFFGIKRGFLKENPISRLDFAERKRKEIETIPTGNVEAMLKHALKNDLALLPYLVFGFFSGIRPDGELQKLEWDDAKLSSKEIVIRPEVSKTNRRRFPKISPNAAAWLELYQERGGTFEGKVCPYSGEELRQHRVTNWKAAGIEKWIQQGMRHTFCSNHLAYFKKVDELVLQSGHDSVDTMWRNYHKGVTDKEAKKFWAIRPPKKAGPKNVIRMVA
jgi:integrase